MPSAATPGLTVPGPRRYAGPAASFLELIRGADRLRDRDLGLTLSARVDHHRGDVRRLEELLERCGGLPFVDHEHEAVADAEAVVDRSARPALFRDRAEPVG